MNTVVKNATIGAPSITLVVNGVAQTTAARTLAQWVEQQGHTPNGLATALNSQFVPRTQRATQVLNEGDTLVTFQPIEGG